MLIAPSFIWVIKRSSLVSFTFWKTPQYGENWKKTKPSKANKVLALDIERDCLVALEEAPSTNLITSCVNQASNSTKDTVVELVRTLRNQISHFEVVNQQKQNLSLIGTTNSTKLSSEIETGVKARFRNEMVTILVEEVENKGLVITTIVITWETRRGFHILGQFDLKKNVVVRSMKIDHRRVTSVQPVFTHLTTTKGIQVRYISFRRTETTLVATNASRYKRLGIVSG